MYKSFINIIVFLSTLLIFVDYRISIVVLFSSLVIISIPRILKSKLSKLREEQVEGLKKYFEKVMDLLSGKFRINKFTIRKFKEEHRKSLELCEDRGFVFGKFKTLSDLINAFGIYIVNINTFIIVAILLSNREISIGGGVAAFGYTRSFLEPIRNILNCKNFINSTKGLVDETIGFLDGKVISEEELKESFTVNKLSLEKHL